MPSKLLQKVQKSATTIGLLVLLPGLILIQYLFRNNRANPVNQAVIWLSPYRNLSKYIFAQARLESADFTSNIYRKTNNPLGMGHAYVRPQLGHVSNTYEAGHSNPMQGYRNDTQGFRDMFLWFDFGKFPKFVPDVKTYVRELKKRKYFGLSEHEYLADVERNMR